MSYTVILHVTNEDPIIAELERLPEHDSTCIIATDLRKRDGKAVHYATTEATAFIFPWSRISFIEVLPSDADRGEVLEFFRD